MATDAMAGKVSSGVASYYGKRFHGRRTANGERFNMNALTAAHRSLPFGTKVKVTNPRTGRSVTVRINDRGPFHGGRSIDLSRAAAAKIGMVDAGVAKVKIEIL
ncbi:septal ring lytic transglycosylase RlpA family protein [Acuticoccus sp. I52.16.1]|nr:septal ring lytic transglycosylase RlpA family protein [Acuticoccus sp. I52.16.1]UOM36828.1 septal ring lytic transglycosylase RlpA family protein [Acuticoccus sp. I52.16.1]